MAKKKPYTPNYIIRSALRKMVWLRSRERTAKLQEYNYRCAVCGKKHSKAKGKECSVEVHHVDGIDWDGLIKEIRDRLLSGRLIPLCVECHHRAHDRDTNGLFLPKLTDNGDDPCDGVEPDQE